MKQNLTLIIIFFSVSLFSQSFWRPVDESSILQSRDLDRGVIPVKYSTNHLNVLELVDYLKKAPIQFNRKQKSISLNIPMPDGTFMLFDIVKSPVLMPELAKKYPNISSYKGISRENKKINIRFNLGANGFHASIYWKNNNIYIDPFAKGINDYYISYFTKDYVVDVSDINLSCGVKSDDTFEEDIDFENPIFPDELLSYRDEAKCDSVHQYNYRLALACTGEWAQKHGGTKEKVLADMVTSVNRLNQIYENEFAIHLNLIGNNDKLIWLDPSKDPYQNPTNGVLLLTENYDAINNTINKNSYDIGHIFTNGCINGLGGIARLQSVCQDSKPRGVTCHYTDNLNYIITNVTAHEMGHQFSAEHTFNNCGGGNESSFGYEPGSGTTIMSYCGSCGPNNVQYKCLENFHAFSIEQIKEYSRIGGGSGCAEVFSTSNSAPEVVLEYQDGFSIPISTPFVLEGSAFDCDGDDLTYSWEEMDLGPLTPLGSPVLNSPLFVAKEPVDVPVRYFPSLRDIIYNYSSKDEILPTYNRNMNFRFIARDNDSDAGGSSWDDVSFKVDETSGPFLVKFPNTTKSFVSGEAIEVTWDVANTDNDIVNCKEVDILLSFDIGFTYPYILRYKTPNDGKELVYLPDSISKKVRIMVKASNNIFFDISNSIIKIEEPIDTIFGFDLEQVSGKVCLPTIIESNIKTRSFHGYSDSIRFEIQGLPEYTDYDIIPKTVKAGDNAIISFNFENVVQGGFFEPIILAISSTGDTIKRVIDWNLYSNNFKDISIYNPINGSSGQVQNTTFKWHNPERIDYANIYISKDPSFPVNQTIFKSFIRDSIFSLSSPLEFSSLYYWKLEFGNDCGIISPDTLYTFSTFAKDCNEFVNDKLLLINSKQITKSTVKIVDSITVTDVSLTMKGTHKWFKELAAFLVSPSEDTITLFNHKSFNYQGPFNLSFDDEAVSKVKSPPSGTFKPEKPLSTFIGKNGKGEWSLLIEDNKNQQSGSLKYFSLTVCSNTVLKNPKIINNNLFKIPLDSQWPITQEHLKVVDDNNTPEQLIFTITKEPVYCNIYVNNKILNVGSRFTQSDINNGSVKIKYSGNDIVQDKFYFTVIDGEGGWIGITPFEFKTDPDLDGVDEQFNDYVHVYPNPINNTLNISIEKTGEFLLEIIDINGQKRISKIINGESISKLDLTALTSGIYVIKINNEKFNYVDKIIKQK